MTTVIRRYAQMEADGMSVTEMLNAGNRSRSIPQKQDVLVTGAGMAGLMYAIRLKKLRPETSITVLESAPEPKYKVGESTLAPFPRFCQEHILPLPYMLRIFNVKEGLEFRHLEEPNTHWQDIGALDLSYQLERRVSELLFILKAQRMGINVYHGVRVDSSSSVLKAPINRVVCRTSQPAVAPNGISHRLRALWARPQRDEINLSSKMVIDASGPERSLISKQGSVKKKFDGMDFHSSWAYFEEDPNAPGQVPDEWPIQHSAHLCSKEGWSWWLPIMSFEESKRSHLMDLVTYLLDLYDAGVDDEVIPKTSELCNIFECKRRQIMSVGFCVRQETMENFKRDPAEGDGATFWSIARAYPMTRKMLIDEGCRYKLMQKPYGKGTFFNRSTMAYYQTKVAGEGWMAIGNATGFTSPLMSPGLNCLCLPQAWLAAKLTAENLQSKKKIWEEYSQFVQMKQLPGLRKVDTMLYQAWKTTTAFNEVLPLFFINAMGKVTERYALNVYKDSDVQWNLGAGEPLFDEMHAEIYPIASQEPTEEALEELVLACNRWRKQYVEANGAWSKYSKHLLAFTDELAPKDQLHRERWISRCGRCNLKTPTRLIECPSCAPTDKVTSCTAQSFGSSRVRQSSGTSDRIGTGFVEHACVRA
jgi:flavin-dependent dehydrogenase